MSENILTGAFPDNDYRYYLEHHGILGMKWGVRRYQDKTGRLTKAGRERYSSTNKTPSEKQESAELLALAATYAIPIGILAATAGIEAVAQKRAEKKFEKAKKDLENKKLNAKIDKKTGLMLREDDEGVETDIKNINPMYKYAEKTTESVPVGYDTYVTRSKHPEYMNNCVLCTVAAELRRRGYDCSANPAWDGMSGPKVLATCFPGGKAKVNDVNKLVKSVDLKTGKFTTYNDDLFNSRYKKACIDASKGLNTEQARHTIDNLSKEKNSRGGLFVNWSSGAGHAIQYEVRDGKVRLIDGQVGKIIEKPKEVEQYLSRATFSTSYRTDNLPLNSKKLKEYVS